MFTGISSLLCLRTKIQTTWSGEVSIATCMSSTFHYKAFPSIFGILNNLPGATHHVGASLQQRYKFWPCWRILSAPQGTLAWYLRLVGFRWMSACLGVIFLPETEDLQSCSSTRFPVEDDKRKFQNHSKIDQNILAGSRGRLMNKNQNVAFLTIRHHSKNVYLGSVTLCPSDFTVPVMAVHLGFVSTIQPPLYLVCTVWLSRTHNPLGNYSCWQAASHRRRTLKANLYPRHTCWVCKL